MKICQKDPQSGLKKEPKKGAYTEADLLKYKSILLYTNAHKRDVNNVDSPIKGNRGKNIKI